MLNLGEIDAIERELRASIVALNKKLSSGVTVIEAADNALVWSGTFEDIVPIVPSHNLDNLIARAPLFICAVASEIGFRFEGVGTEYWAKLSGALGLSITMTQRARIGDAFEALSKKYRISRPSESAFSSHFSIISWPIANALLPIDLVGPVTRLMARAPAGALPGPGRAANLPSLRAWAAAAEGARLVDWLRLDAPSSRALSALLTDNRGSVLPDATYSRVRGAIGLDPTAFLAARAARLRALTVKPSTSGTQSLGRLAITMAPDGVRLFASWPALPPVLFDEARLVARSAGWRPRLWGTGGFLHPDTALGAGPFALAMTKTPADDDLAYPGAAELFGVGSDIAVILAARGVDWTSTLIFDVNEGRTAGEQRLGQLSDTSGTAWVACCLGSKALDGLRPIGSACGYRFFAADLAVKEDRAILIREGLLASEGRHLLARHPIDAIGAPLGVVRPDRPYLFYKQMAAGPEGEVQTMKAGGRVGTVSGGGGRPGLRCEPPVALNEDVAQILLFERDGAFEALIERRLQLRVESRLALRDVSIICELEIAGRLVARQRDTLCDLPMTIGSSSQLFAPLYSDAVRTKLLETGTGVLRFTIGRSERIEIPLERPIVSVEWSDGVPTLVGATLDCEVVSAPARSPHRFATTARIETPQRGAAAFGLRLSDGRVADPIQILTSSTFDLGDFVAHFGDDLGSRRMVDHGRGVGELARARVAWARAMCVSLPAIFAKSCVIRQFEEPLVYNLCGREWCQTEQADRSRFSDPHDALWCVALERGLASLPDGTTKLHEEAFSGAFAHHARILDPEWPLGDSVLSDGMMDEALNAGFAEAVLACHAKNALMYVDPDDCDFGSPSEDWEDAGREAIRRIQRSELSRLIVPSAGGEQLRSRSYAEVSTSELAEDLAAWTRRYALPRGQLTPDAAASALQLWLSPAACDDVDAAVHVMATDPFVARAARYVAIRLGTTLGSAVS